jgi:hypothetical protein
MSASILVTFIIVATLGFGLRRGRDGGLIARRPYNNRYNDATAARDESSGR